jgi:hypothetical protein
MSKYPLGGPSCMETLRLETLRRKIKSDPDDPDGCAACGAIAGACKEYPFCPGSHQNGYCNCGGCMPSQGGVYGDPIFCGKCGGIVDLNAGDLQL